MSDAWDPAQYERFRAERMKPFDDLIGMIRFAPGMHAIDLGCGTGELTARLAERIPDGEVLGIDSSEAMLARAAPGSGLSFRKQDIATVDDWSAWDIVFSHAALHWIPDHERLFARLLDGMRAGAQVAIQVPDMGRQLSHRIALDVAREFALQPVESPVLAIERYAEIFFDHGLVEQACTARVYGHVLARASDVVEWVKGTTLTPYLARLDEAGQRAFVDLYRMRLLDAVGGDRAPFFFAFRRLLLWGRKR